MHSNIGCESALQCYAHAIGIDDDDDDDDNMVNVRLYVPNIDAISLLLYFHVPGWVSRNSIPKLISESLMQDIFL